MSILSLARHSSGGLGLSPRRRGVKGTTVPSIIQDGLIAEWRFDDGAGQQITDYSGNGFHAFLGSSEGADASEPVWSATGVDSIIDHPANRIELFPGSNLGISGGAPRTVVAVVQMDRTGSGISAGAPLIWKGDGTNGRTWEWYGQFNTSNASPQLSIQGASHTFSTLNYTDGAWDFVALVQSGANLNTCTCYMNGDSELSTTSATIDTTGTVAMAGRSSGTGGFKWIKHAYCMVYDRALSPAEVAHNRMALAAILAGRAIMLP
jgi:hypothetical protein